MTSVEIWAAITGAVVVVGQFLDYLRTRKPTREVNDALAEINVKLEAQAERITTLEGWKNS